MIKKSIFLIIATIFITQNVVGVDVLNNNSKCNESSGLGNGATNTPIELKSVWTPNEINVHFHDDANGTVTTKTCTYNEIFDLPEQPTKKGHTFAGWEVLNPQAPITPISYGELCGIPNLVTATKGSACYSYNWTEYNGSKCYGYNGSSNNSYPCSETPDLAGPGEWKTEFDYGTIYGEASCNTTNGTVAVKTDAKYTKNTNTPSGYEEYCWCRVTGFTKSGETNRCNVASSAWVFRYDSGSADNCARNCEYNCANSVRINSDFREAVFDAVQYQPEPETPTEPTNPGYEYGELCDLSNKKPDYSSSFYDNYNSWEEAVSVFLYKGEKQYFGFSGTSGWDPSLPRFQGLDVDEWKVNFDFGTVKGTSLCSSTSGTFATPGNPDEINKGTHCWCKVTSFTPKNGGQQCQYPSASWVYRQESEYCYQCSANCLAILQDYRYEDCLTRNSIEKCKDLLYFIPLREALFNATQ